MSGNRLWEIVMWRMTRYPTRAELRRRIELLEAELAASRVVISLGAFALRPPERSLPIPAQRQYLR